MGRLKLTPTKDTSVFRKIAMGTWRTVKDPTVYGLLEIDMKPVQGLIEAYSKKHGVKITPSQLVGKALAQSIKQRPEINGMIRGSKIYLRDNVRLFYQVNIPGKGDDKVKKATLSGCNIAHAEDLTVAEIAKQMQDKVDKVRSGKDKEIAKNINSFKYIPWCLSSYYLSLASFLTYGLNLNLSAFGVPKDPFGSAMITNVGGMGVETAWAPLCPYTRVPLLLSIGTIKDRAWVVDGEVTVRPIMRIGVTFDHRLIDGVHAAHIAKVFEKCFMEPEKYLLAD